MMSLTDSLFAGDLLRLVELSLQTPQFGPFSGGCEFLEQHLVKVVAAIRDVEAGVFHPAVPHTARPAMQTAVELYFHQLRQHVWLHDFQANMCLWFKYRDGRRELVSYVHWTQNLKNRNPGSVKAFCEKKGIAEISYSHPNRHHATVAAALLRTRWDIDDLVVRGVENHEVAGVFGEEGGMLSIPLFQKYFGAWTMHELGYGLLVNYVDVMAHLDTEGKPNLTGFLNLVKSWQAWQQFNLLQEMLSGIDGLDHKKVQRSLGMLRNSPDAFQTEDFEQTRHRLTVLCRSSLDPKNAQHVREALRHAVPTLPADSLEQVVKDATTQGRISSETAKILGPFERPVRQVIISISG